jgi:hypothetical protein
MSKATWWPQVERFLDEQALTGAARATLVLLAPTLERIAQAGGPKPRIGAIDGSAIIAWDDDLPGRPDDHLEVQIEADGRAVWFALRDAGIDDGEIDADDISEAIGVDPPAWALAMLGVEVTA